MGPSSRSITIKVREHEHQRDDDPRHDQQNKSDGDGQAKQDGRAEIFPEWLRMPQRCQVDRLGIVVRGEIERRRAHAEQGAEARD